MICKTPNNFVSQRHHSFFYTQYPSHPMAIYQVSGEYAMLYHGAKAGAFDLKTTLTEVLHSMRRAGLLYFLIVNSLLHCSRVLNIPEKVPVVFKKKNWALSPFLTLFILFIQRYVPLLEPYVNLHLEFRLYAV